MSLVASRRDSLSSTYVATYSRLFNGLLPEQISPNQNAAKFWSNLLELDIDSDFISTRVGQISKEECLGRVKPVLNAIVRECIHYARNAPASDVRTVRAVKTLSLVSRCILRKNPTGWEVMEIFAGGVGASDEMFNELTVMISETLSSSDNADLRHQVLQLAVILVAGLGQLSPGAYFLRCDLFPAIVTVITTLETEQYTFEASLLLSLLANYHKSDAAKLNPYLHCIRETTNEDMMHKVCWASNYAADAVIKSYQKISDDSPPTLGSAFGSLLSSLRPDRAFAATPVDPPRELFKSQPIEACVILLPIYEFMSTNIKFHDIAVESVSGNNEKQVNARISPFSYTLITLSSYLLTHASSVHAHRAIAYANLALSLLLVMVESPNVMTAFLTANTEIRLCRQRLPLLPLCPPRKPVCAMLDCCVLWLRHNLHKRLEVHPYIKCIRVCYRLLWTLKRERLRLEYHWQELWTSLIGLLDFVANKLDTLITTGGIEQLVQETILVLDLALCHSSAILPTPQVIHELVYETVRSAAVFRKQQLLLEKLALPKSTSRDHSFEEGYAEEALKSIIAVTDQFEVKIRDAGAASASRALRVVSREIEKDGLSYGKDLHAEEPPKQSDDVAGFARYAYLDCMSLMP